MNKTEKLSDEDREFFRLVTQAAFSNPFGDERVETDVKIIGHAVRGTSEARTLKVMEAVATRVA